MTIRWSSPLLIGLNLVTMAVWLLAMIDIARTPKGDWDGGRKLVAMIVIGGMSVGCLGLFIPAAPLVWFFDWRTKEKWGHFPGRSVRERQIRSS